MMSVIVTDHRMQYDGRHSQWSRGPVLTGKVQ